MVNLKTFGAAAAVALVPMMGAAATISVDDFSTFQVASAPGLGSLGPNSVATAPAGSIGDRTLTASGNGVNTPGSSTDILISGGIGAVSTSAGVTGQGRFTWDAGGIDFTDNGTNDTFVLDIVTLDLGANYELGLNGTVVSTATVSAASNILFDFADFDMADLMNANTISLFVSGDDAFDTSFTFLGAEDRVPPSVVVPPSAVPLPAAGFLLLAGLGGMAGLRRRKKNAA